MTDQPSGWEKILSKNINLKWVWSGNNTIRNCWQTHGIVRKSHTTNTRHQEDKQSKATSSLFPIEIIAILERTQSNAQQNIEQNIIPIVSNNQQRLNNNRTTALERTAAKVSGGLDAFYWNQIFALDSAVVEAQNVSSHGGFLTIAMYHHREIINPTSH